MLYYFIAGEIGIIELEYEKRLKNLPFHKVNEQEEEKNCNCDFSVTALDVIVRPKQTLHFVSVVLQVAENCDIEEERHQLLDKIYF